MKQKTVRAVDLFCGAGGTSKGLALACEQLGIPVDLTAINHWEVAIATHKQNHPWAEHLHSRIEDVDPTVVVPDGRLELLVASPECTHFSVARGGKPKEDQKRASPWVILPWLSRLYVKNVLIENVPEFRSWGPLGADGHPLKSKKGETFKAFINAIQSHGYQVSYRVLNAADYGDVTSRRRLFILAKRGNSLVGWPRPTHSKGGKAKGTKPWRAAREIIDWSIEGQSIFNRERPLADATIRRIIAGLEKFGGPELRPFLVVLRGTSAKHLRSSAKDIDEPLPSPVACGTQIGLADAFLLSAGSRGPDVADIEEPVPAIIPKSGLAVAKPFLVQTAYSTANGKCVKDTDEPTWAITGRPEQGLVEPAFMLSAASGGAPRSVEEPVPTMVGRGGLGLARSHLMHVTHGGRSRSIDEPLPAVTGANRGEQALVSAHLQTHFGERDGQRPRVHSIDEPTPALTSREPALVEGFLANYHGQSTASSLDSPVPTLDTRDRLALVQPVIDGVALDIRFRMLQPHELAAAMGFGSDYAFQGNRADAVRQIGNAVAVNVAKALCAALLNGKTAEVEGV